MKHLSLIVVFIFAVSCSSSKKAERTYSGTQTQEVCGQEKFSLAVHGGVGYVANAAQSAVLKRILEAGHQRLKDGAKGLDVVQYMVEEMEDSGIFNAGKGGTRTSLKTVELDASIMDGSNLKAGAVASLKDVKNPIKLARTVMDKTRHVFMVAEGASKFARENKFEMVNTDYFVGVAPKPGDKAHYGTVGAVALDRCGHLAAATSTGGLFGKLPGRVGDSPIIGAGTYANDATVAVSATGAGEKFIRATVASRISAILQYTDRSLDSAMKEALDLVVKLEGDGGIIAIDPQGNIVTNTTLKAPMPRGWVKEDGVVVVKDPEA